MFNCMQIKQTFNRMPLRRPFIPERLAYKMLRYIGLTDLYQRFSTVAQRGLIEPLRVNRLSPITLLTLKRYDLLI